MHGQFFSIDVVLAGLPKVNRFQLQVAVELLHRQICDSHVVAARRMLEAQRLEGCVPAQRLAQHRDVLCRE